MVHDKPIEDFLRFLEIEIFHLLTNISEGKI